MSITAVPVSNDSLASNPNSITARWGVVANEYKIGGKQVDLQDLMVAISQRRATVVEGEVAPQAASIRKRNERLEELGNALAEMTGFQAAFEKDDGGNDDGKGWFHTETAEVLKSLGFECTYYAKAEGDRDERPEFYCNAENHDEFSAKKKVVEHMIQRLKSEIDGLNNEAQMDMNRLQQLVDRRDESYSTATNLMTAISDTRANLIRNL